MVEGNTTSKFSHSDDPTSDNDPTNSNGQHDDNDDTDEEEEEDDDSLMSENYRDKYRVLKRKLKCLLYEQECFHEELRKYQKKCLRVGRDKSFLLDRLLQYEQPTLSSDDENTTDTSEDEEREQVQRMMKSKPKTHKKVGPTSVSKARCRRVENGKQCHKLVSTTVKSGICVAHRQQLAASHKRTSTKNTGKGGGGKGGGGKGGGGKGGVKHKQGGGGKDISQIREAMEAESRLGYGAEDDDDDLVIDLPH